MPLVSLNAKRCLGLALGGVLATAGYSAHASDLYVPGPRYEQRGYYEPQPPAPVYGEPRYERRTYERRVVEGEECRIVHRRSIDPYGREIVQRVRVCDEAVAERSPRWAERRPDYRDDLRGYPGPRPPAAVADPDDDDDFE